VVRVKPLMYVEHKLIEMDSTLDITTFGLYTLEEKVHGKGLPATRTLCSNNIRIKVDVPFQIKYSKKKNIFEKARRLGLVLWLVLGFTLPTSPHICALRSIHFLSHFPLIITASKKYWKKPNHG